MRIVIQKVERASVTVEGECVGSIDQGFMVLVGAEEGDTLDDVRFIGGKIAGMRVFEDENDKLNLSIKDVGGEILLVSQFTLLGDARKSGRRPSFSRAAAPEEAESLFNALTDMLRAEDIRVETGRFRTHMKVEIVNDGPVTILLDSRKTF